MVVEAKLETTTLLRQRLKEENVGLKAEIESLLAQQYVLLVLCAFTVFSYSPSEGCSSGVCAVCGRSQFRTKEDNYQKLFAEAEHYKNEVVNLMGLMKEVELANSETERKVSCLLIFARVLVSLFPRLLIIRFDSLLTFSF